MKPYERSRLNAALEKANHLFLPADQPKQIAQLAMEEVVEQRIRIDLLGMRIRKLERENWALERNFRVHPWRQLFQALKLRWRDLWSGRK